MDLEQTLQDKLAAKKDFKVVTKIQRVDERSHFTPTTSEDDFKSKVVIKSDKVDLIDNDRSIDCMPNIISSVTEDSILVMSTHHKQSTKHSTVYYYDGDLAKTKKVLGFPRNILAASYIEDLEFYILLGADGCVSLFRDGDIINEFGVAHMNGNKVCPFSVKGSTVTYQTGAQSFMFTSEMSFIELESVSS